MDIKDLLAISVEQHASDLHLIPGLPPQLRIAGTLFPIKNYSILTSEDTKNLIYSFITEEQKHIFEKNLVGEMALSFPHIGNFRVSLFHQLHGRAAVFRIIPEIAPTFEELFLPQAFKPLLGLSHGLILVTGATGSGKSTTLAAMIDYINSFRSCNIITIEDPIEFVHQSKKSILNQLQVGRDTTDFATALRSSLRQDPDVILLGELRDLETMRLALIAAETGHLVLATLHSTSAPLAINRFADVFPSEEKNRVRNLLSETLQAVICQTLVKKISGGRLAAFEIMLCTPAIRHFIRQDMAAHMESTIQTNTAKGMCTLEYYLQTLVKKRLINSKVAEHVIQARNIYKDAITPVNKE
ncbi:MAG: PilT/PilU family type 4a pilus ATPase [Gammaproteobacteria bacterium]|nr:PilT/PilU family type 4a pilus ATPase [Gammaproteobacteria bacterium]